MDSVVMQAELLNLPEVFAIKLRGKKIEIIENGESITIKPVESIIDEAYGILCDSSFGTDALMEQKRIEKELEYGG